MLNKIFHNTKDFLIGSVASLAFIVMPYLYFYTDVFESGLDPYEVTEASYNIEDYGPEWLNGKSIVIKASFIKTDCEFRRLEVFGNYADEWFIIPWSNTLDVDAEGDRIKGEATLRITAQPYDKDYDQVQIRTRHMCLVEVDGKEKEVFVDKIFWTFDIVDSPVVSYKGN